MRALSLKGIGLVGGSLMTLSLIVSDPSGASLAGLDPLGARRHGQSLAHASLKGAGLTPLGLIAPKCTGHRPLRRQPDSGIDLSHGRLSLGHWASWVCGLIGGLWRPPHWHSASRALSVMDVGLTAFGLVASEPKASAHCSFGSSGFQRCDAEA